jgi:mannose-1-phosphate guanylyltransferase
MMSRLLGNGSAWEELTRIARGRAGAIPISARRRAAVVLAGGRGMRLQHVAERFEGMPLPKQFCSFGSGQSLLQQTIERIDPIVSQSRTVVVAQREYGELAGRQLARHGGAQLLLQPSDAGTAMALLLGLIEIGMRSPDATVLVTPADHGFERVGDLENALERAYERAADRTGTIVLIGAEADLPRTDFGWIVPSEGGEFRQVVRFVEKPSEEIARDLLGRRALWSTMLAVGQLRAWLDRFEQRYPLVVRALMFYAGMSQAERGDYLDLLYRSIRGIDLSRELLAHSDQLEVLALAPTSGWSDLGTEERLLSHLQRSRPGLISERSRRGTILPRDEAVEQAAS